MRLYSALTNCPASILEGRGSRPQILGWGSWDLHKMLVYLRSFPVTYQYTAAATLAHYFVTSRLDYCSSVLPATRLNCLDRVLRSAALVIGRLSKFDHIYAYMRHVLHFLPIRQHIEFRVAVLIWYSLRGQAPAYLTDLCCPSFG